jgi:hypothetical protein
MAKALILSEELIDHITNVIGMNPSKVVMTKDRISFVRGKQIQYSFRCKTDNFHNQTVEMKYVYDKWEQALNYLCDMSETYIFVELLQKGGIKLTSVIVKL